MIPVSPVLPKTGAEAVERTFAKDQPQYLPLPAIVQDAGAGIVTTRWALTWRERLAVLISGNMWLQQMAFGMPLQPVKPRTDQPSLEECL